MYERSYPTFVTRLVLTTLSIDDLVVVVLPCDIEDEDLIFRPSLYEVRTCTSPVTLRLYQRIRGQAAPHGAYSKDAAIGTGRPQDRIVLIAETHGPCLGETQACMSLAIDLLRSTNYANGQQVTDKALATLYRLPVDRLQGVSDSLAVMATMSDREWVERSAQMFSMSQDLFSACAVMDPAYVRQLELELFFLSVGRADIEFWARHAFNAMVIDDEARKEAAELFEETVSTVNSIIEELFLH